MSKLSLLEIGRKFSFVLLKGELATFHTQETDRGFCFTVRENSGVIHGNEFPVIKKRKETFQNSLKEPRNVVFEFDGQDLILRVNGTTIECNLDELTNSDETLREEMKIFAERNAEIREAQLKFELERQIEVLASKEEEIRKLKEKLFVVKSENRKLRQLSSATLFPWGAESKSSIDGGFDSVDYTEELCVRIQEIFDRMQENEKNDRYYFYRSSSSPKRVTQVVRIQNPMLWNRYVSAQNDIVARLNPKTFVGTKSNCFAEWQHELLNLGKDQFSSGNEIFAFCCYNTNAEREGVVIMATGSSSNSRSTSYVNSGITIHQNPHDAVSKWNKGDSDGGAYALLLVRVCLGKVGKQTNSFSGSGPFKIHFGDYDSGMSSNCFYVLNPWQIYPELFITVDKIEESKQSE
jgi:hypothetical protein